MKKKSAIVEFGKFVIIFAIGILVWLVIFAAFNPNKVDYEPFNGASIVCSFITTLFVYTLLDYNYMQKSKQALNATYHNVKVQLDKKEELLGKANETVNAFMQHEENVHIGIKDKKEKYDLAVLVEKYPNLKSDHSVMELLKQINECESSIAYRKEQYNILVNDYNSAIHSFPSAIICSIAKLEDALYYEDRIKQENQ